MVHTLLSFGANASMIDDQRNTPVDLARENMSAEAVARLEQVCIVKIYFVVKLITVK